MKQQIWEKRQHELLQELGSDIRGISSVEASRRLEQYGKNELQTGKKKHEVVIFLEQFADFLVIILLAAAGISAVLGDWESTAVILTVVVINAVLGTVQTLKAEASLDSLKRMSAPTAKVLRDGNMIQIPGNEVTVGDVVALEAGDFVCADGRILECAGVKCDESALTGESIPVEKNPEPITGEVALGDRKNMVFSGSFVTYGRGTFLVTGIGMHTEMGKIAALMRNAEEKKTPLQVNLDQFGKKLTWMILLLCTVVFGISVFVQKEDVMHAFLFAVALAVAAIPEALSSIVTIVLSFGTQKMAKENVIIRKLQAVEGLGSVSVICSDKTGTLTQNRMTVEKIYVEGTVVLAEEVDFQNLGQETLLRCALLCSDASVNEQGEVGDPTETALVRWGEDHGVDEDTIRRKYPRVAELPFDSDRKMMSTVHELSGGLLMVTKGAVDVLLERCMISLPEREKIQRVNEMFSMEGLRVLAFACRPINKTVVSVKDERGMAFLGMVAMMDPPREESAAAVEECIAAGIRPIMITGDHKITAAAIARRIGILTPGTEAVEGSAIENMTQEELRRFVPGVSVYARVSPEHKIRIVRAWQELGNLVAMTGDGVNDAPALKQADIGVAMGITGTEVSKDAAGMVLADDNFATIVKAVKNGRNVYGNIKRAIHFLLSGNTAGILAVLSASILGMPVPFAAVHLLFINLLTDSLPAIALGLEPHVDAVMQEKPRTGEFLTKAFMLDVAVEGLVLAAATIAAFWIGLRSSEGVGSTMAFSTLCLSRLLHGFSCKNQKVLWGTGAMWNNRVLLIAIAVGGLLLGAVLTIPPLAQLLHVVKLSGELLGIVVGLAVGSLAAVQLLKFIRFR